MLHFEQDQSTWTPAPLLRAKRGIFPPGFIDIDDGISITFHTEPTDLTGPQVTSVYPPSNHIYNTEGVFNIMFDEVLDITSIDTVSIQFQSSGQALTVDHIEYTLDEITTLSVKPFSPLLNNSNCVITLIGITLSLIHI